jgi:hypothetical protein
MVKMFGKAPKRRICSSKHWSMHILS